MPSGSTEQHPESGHFPGSAPAGTKVPLGLRLAGQVLRALFIAAVVVITARVSIPQSEHIWTVYETPGDLIRLLLGFLFCGWVVFQLFKLPTDVEAYRTWVYFGLFAVPFAIICAIAIW